VPQCGSAKNRLLGHGQFGGNGAEVGRGEKGVGAVAYRLGTKSNCAEFRLAPEFTSWRERAVWHARALAGIREIASALRSPRSGCPDAHLLKLRVDGTNGAESQSPGSRSAPWVNEPKLICPNGAGLRGAQAVAPCHKEFHQGREFHVWHRNDATPLALNPTNPEFPSVRCATLGFGISAPLVLGESATSKRASGVQVHLASAD